MKRGPANGNFMSTFGLVQVCYCSRKAHICNQLSNNLQSIGKFQNVLHKRISCYVYYTRLFSKHGLIVFLAYMADRKDHD
jgi:hypothetical protein